MAINYCRRETYNERGDVAKVCMKPITKVNALNWCQECRERLPLWPRDEVKEEGKPL